MSDFTKKREETLGDWVAKQRPNLYTKLRSRVSDLQVYTEQFDDMADIENIEYTIDDYRKNLFGLKQRIKDILNDFEI